MCFKTTFVLNTNVNEPQKCYRVGMSSIEIAVLPHYRLFHSEDVKLLLRLSSLQASRTDLILCNSDLMANSNNAEHKHLDSLQEVIFFVLSGDTHLNERRGRVLMLQPPVQK